MGREVIVTAHVGPMFSGKSDEAIGQAVDRFRRTGLEQGRHFFVFNSSTDTRGDPGGNVITFHNGRSSVAAIGIASSSAFLEHFVEIPQQVTDMHGLTPVSLRPIVEDVIGIGIDEAQFLDERFPEALVTLRRLCRMQTGGERLPPLRVNVAGLDNDFRGESFGPMPRVMCIADQVVKHVAVCQYPVEGGKFCGGDAFWTQRLRSDGSPARYDDKIVVIGDQDIYVPRCHQHFQVPGRPPLRLRD